MEAVVRVNDVKSYFDVTLQLVARTAKIFLRHSPQAARAGLPFLGDRRLPTKQPGGEASVIGAPR
ncbi:hypothetical protein BURMUCGD1_4928 [Burkholderia multivorans CGD1]|nr:hypothetical protein BURMUCGD1_4928 [Burkholderia multivorans CGD1]